MKKIALALALVASSTLHGALAQTQEYNPSWYISPSINAMDPDDLYGVDKTGYGLGVRFGMPVSQWWDVQVGPTWAQSKHNGFKYTQGTLGVDGLLMLSRSSFRPFLLLGAGAEYDNLDVPSGSNTSRTSPYANAGIGFQWVINNRTSLQADVRQVYGFLRNDSFGNSNNSRNNYLTIGMNFAFGEPPAPAPVTRTEPPPPPPPPAPPPPPPAPRFERVTLSATELFAFNSSVLNMPQPKLDQIAEVLGGNTDVKDVTITGYADRLGKAKYNQKLSQDRANAVKTYLVGKGIDAGRLTAVGRGEENPVATCDNIKKRAELIKCLEPNRRVEVEQITVQKRVQ